MWLSSIQILKENILAGRQGPQNRNGTESQVPSSSEDTIHLQTPSISPRVEPRPYGTAVTVTGHHTGWAAF
ncbi:hypothetical protein TNCV_1966151 [Trichonephila clavipes]|nr:hypothetical protein TNCV_1966151 [Trichonephila clavipes]